MEFSGNATVENDFIYLVMNKPVGYVCSAVSDSHSTVYELLPQEMQKLVQNAKRGHRLHTIGRLDADTSGLLLFTDDGYFSHNLTAPDCHVSKTYVAKLARPVTNAEKQIYQRRTAEGILLPPEKKAEEYLTQPAKLDFLADDVCRLTIQEGKFHQVRRMIAALGNEVVELTRVAVGELTLDETLKPGEWRKLSEGEVQLLR